MGCPTKSHDFVGRGGATKRADFGRQRPKEQSGVCDDEGVVLLVDEDISRRTIAVSVKASKLTARGLAYVLRAIGRKIAKHHRAKQTPHGKQSVKKLMAHGASASSIELSGDTKLFDRVARKWNVDYAFYKTGPDKYLLFFKAGQADAMTACFSEYSRKVLNKSKSRRIPIRDQLKRASQQLAQKRPRPKERVQEVAHADR